MATMTSMSDDLLREIMRAASAARPAQSLMISPRALNALKTEFAPYMVAEPTLSTNPIYAGYTTKFAGVPVEVVDIPPEEIVDWSGCRSPARAKRRRARGFPQRVKITYQERAYLFHRQALANRFEGEWERMAFSLINPR